MGEAEHRAARIAVIGAEQEAIERLVELDGRLTVGDFTADFGTRHDRIDRCAGLLIADGIDDSESADAACAMTRDFLQSDKPVLAFGSGARVLIEAIGGHEFEPRVDANELGSLGDGSPRRNTIFLTVGSKTAMTIGGSGWVTIRDVALHPLPLSHLSPNMMPAALTESSDVVAFEVPGHKWVIGVTWDLTLVGNLPSGFGYVFEAFVDRTVG